MRPGFGRGFTLAESMIAVLVLAVSVTAVAGVLSAARSQGAATGDLTSTQDLARELMEEISAKAFADPDGPSLAGPESGENGRDVFDNVDDYHGYADTLERQEGIGTKKYKRSVTVTHRATRDGVDAATGDFAVVQVTVTGPDNRKVTLSQVVTCVVSRR